MSLSEKLGYFVVLAVTVVDIAEGKLGEVYEDDYKANDLVRARKRLALFVALSAMWHRTGVLRVIWQLIILTMPLVKKTDRNTYSDKQWRK
jgi:hypothetical protein